MKTHRQYINEQIKKEPKFAEALAKAPKRPKRSVLFVWHCGEEKGLWGSEYFNKFPTVDIKKVIAQLNIDMIGRSKKAGNTASCTTTTRSFSKPPTWPRCRSCGCCRWRCTCSRSSSPSTAGAGTSERWTN